MANIIKFLEEAGVRGELISKEELLDLAVKHGLDEALLDEISSGNLKSLSLSDNIYAILMPAEDDEDDDSEESEDIRSIA
ncbi:hypothetical protein [Kangiella sp. TOML190]|uniref:hypothetical protein n=1 Tax=Kangiella sp. TOML190 TaxID=2931351 RepID=UPI00203D13B9|nr:hypothetical protein [Kangiella sp. TOML190]